MRTSWRLYYMDARDKHPELVLRDLQEVFEKHPRAKDELYKIMVESGVVE